MDKQHFWKTWLNNRREFFKHIAMAMVPFLFMMAIHPYGRFMFDMSGSLGGGMFWVVVGNKDLHRDDLAVFHPPQTPFYPQTVQFIKQVGGMPGDTITRQGMTLFNKGHKLGTAKPESSQGVPLEVFDGGVVPEDHFYFYSNHADAFDSRYRLIGFVSKEQVIGKAYRIY